MTTINLRTYYPFYSADLFVEVPDSVAAALLDAERQERNYRRRVYWNRAHYSLDANDGLEHDALFLSISPCEMYERKLTMEQVYAAIHSLPDVQGRRVYAHYILGLSKADIARAEGVAKSRVSESIKRGLLNMEIFLKNMNL